MSNVKSYRPGDRLPPFLYIDRVTGTPRWDRDLRVDSIDPLAEGVRIVHGRGFTMFPSTLAHVDFPVRHDIQDETQGFHRVTVNWCRTLQHPRLVDLAVGDILPPHMCTFDPRNESDWPEMSEDEQKEIIEEFWTLVSTDPSFEFQTVTSVKPGNVPDSAIVVTERYQYEVSMNEERFHSKWTPIEVRLGRRAPSEEHYKRSGKYRHTTSGSVVQFAIHHSGKGRYPSYVHPYDIYEEGLMAPPIRRHALSEPGVTQPYVELWRDWEYLNDGTGPRHPYDPRS